jgi:hypothetical protein
MITDANTKKPCSLDDLAAALSKEDVVACLVLLQRKGLVRRLDDLWEISHDFVARQFALLLGRLRQSLWPKITTFTAAALFVIVIVGTAIGIPPFVQEQAFAELRSLGITVAKRGGKQTASFPTEVADGDVTQAMLDLILVGIDELNLSGSRVTALPGLDKLTALQTLDLSGSQVTALPGLDKLTALRALDLSGSPVTALPELDKLTALQSLVLTENSNLLNEAALLELRARRVSVIMK